MKALTTVNHNELTISFPEIKGVLQRLIHEHLRNRLEDDREEFWRKDKEFKTRPQCMEKIESISEGIIRSIAPTVSVDFQRTLRIPDDGADHFLPPGLGSFPLRHVEDFAGTLPPKWNERGGVMLPIHQSEALWLSFNGRYPMALKVGTGKICAVSGEDWSNGLNSTPQNYCALPDQPWLDGYCIEKGIIRQFVAAPLNKGFTVEEQLTGKGEWGGIQLEAWPLDPKIYWKEELRQRVDHEWEQWLRGEDHLRTHSLAEGPMCCCSMIPQMDMGLAAGGRMKQEIYDDHRDPSDYIPCESNRCFVHLCNAEQWELITGEAPPNTPPSAKDYSDHGFPWFDYYDENQTSLSETSTLGGIKSIKQLESELDQKILPDTLDEAKPKVIVKFIKN